MSEYVIPIIAAAGVLIAGLTLQHTLMRGKLEREVRMAKESQRVEDLKERVYRVEKMGLESSTHITQHRTQLDALQKASDDNRQDHRLLFQKVELVQADIGDVKVGVAKLLNGSRAPKGE